MDSLEQAKFGGRRLRPPEDHRSSVTGVNNMDTISGNAKQPFQLHRQPEIWETRFTKLREPGTGCGWSRGHLRSQVMNLSKEDVWIKPRTPFVLQFLLSVDDGSVSVEQIEVGESQAALGPEVENWLHSSQLLWSGLSTNQQAQAKELLHQNRDVFAKSDEDLRFTESVKHQISLKRSRIISESCYKPK
ncbi:hypothetical protein BSL78_17157 [Apostichopus japonicus]|uniref:Uncharacterized protein n=1 Tax=Stichopus japonicus TaxID=307972 RepID=A0A2G8KDB4_STIJA|nr:hypothetical protein BSL78_17157 [Apostichopus japonicus]